MSSINERKPVELHYGHVDTELLAPWMYVEYLNKLGYQVKEITEVHDNGFCYDWCIRAVDIKDNNLIVSFEHIEVLQWLVESQRIKWN